MKIITVAHQKGGVGKTTLAVNLACCFAHGLKVGILDTDLQKSITEVQTLEGVMLVPFDGRLSSIASLPLDVLIIDTPPYLTNQLPELFAISDFVLVPSKVGFYDITAVRATIELLRQAKQKKTDLKYAIVLNMVKHRTALNDEIKGILEQYNVPLLDTIITDRVSYVRSAIMNGVFNGDDEKAIQEITNLADEILNNLEL